MIKRLILFLFLIHIGSGTAVYSRQKDFRSYLNEAREAMYDGICDTGLSLCYEALDACPRDSLLVVAEINAVMGWGYSELGIKDKALQRIGTSLGLYRSQGDSIGVAFCYNYLGLAHYRSKEYAAADSCFNHSLAIFRKNGKGRQVAAIINNLCMSPGDSETKAGLLQEAIAFNRRINNIWSVASNFNNLGRQYYYLKRFDDALIALDQAKECAEQIGSDNQLSENYQIRSLVYAAQKDYPMAYSALSKKQEIDEAIKDADNRRNAERRIEAMIGKDAAADNGIGYALAIAVALLAVGVATWLCVRLKRRLAKVERRIALEQSKSEQKVIDLTQKEAAIDAISTELQTAKGKLAYLMLFMRSRNELLERIRKQIRDTYKMEPSAQLVHLKKVNSFISQYLQDPKTCDEITAQEDEACKQFIAELSQRYPLVTSGERELAVLLRLDLSPREISLITGNAPKTVSMNRYRLRKHMNLSPSDDLIAILRAI